MRARWPFALALALILFGLGRGALNDWVAATVLPPLTPAVSTEVLARDGSLLRLYPVANGLWRPAVDPHAVDPTYLRMLISYEDRRFYRHNGVDLRALLRAAFHDLIEGHIVSGGSTLTMQVARLLENSGTGHIAGKIRQIRVALALERRLTKAQILSLYLQIAPFGGNLEGVRAATLAYFGKEPRHLTTAQAALLVALPQSPEQRRPDRFPKAARAARARVLMRLAGAGVIPRAEAKSAESEPVPTRRRPFPMLVPQLADRLHAAAPSARVIRTTIDAGLQAQLQELATASVAGQGARLQVAMVAADHRSGAILAEVGSAQYAAKGDGYIDFTRTLRSPGSTLKPLVYGLAFDAGLANPETLIDDRPVDFNGYAPQNFDHLYRGMVHLRTALQMSLNIPAVMLTDAIGPANLMAGLNRAGVKAVVPGGKPGLAVVLGGVGVDLHDLVQLYAAIGRGGVALPLHVTPGSDAAGRRIMSGIAAWQVGDILSGLAPPPGLPENGLSYKTGTSYGHRDAWAVGFDGRDVIGVWMGHADATPVPGAFGGELAAPVLFRAFARMKPTLTPRPPAPTGTLIAPNADLPLPLRVFHPRGAEVLPQPDAPQVAFPPDGAVVELNAGDLLVKVQNGAPPFVWMANGRPVATPSHDRAEVLHMASPGFVTLSVIDAQGRSARVSVQLVR